MTEELHNAPVEENSNEAALTDEDYGQLSEDEARLIELVGYLVQGIVAHPEDVEVEEFFDDVGSVYGVRVHPDDVGRVIGKEGRVANALRQVVKGRRLNHPRSTSKVLRPDGERLLPFLFVPKSWRNYSPNPNPMCMNSSAIYRRGISSSVKSPATGIERI
jgi:predicted RNA-binding protein YlqC (UPF0109 family)